MSGGGTLDINTTTTATIATILLAGILHGPIGQLANYHDFADHTVLFGIPHACDVLSNIGFAIVARALFVGVDAAVREMIAAAGTKAAPLALARAIWSP